jgi:nucleotide-binding universal stress UspA family protein
MPLKVQEERKQKFDDYIKSCIVLPYEKIAVCIDHSYVSAMVLERALKLAKIFSSRLIVIHVIPTVLPYETKQGLAVDMSYMEFMKAADTDIIQLAKKRLEDARVKGEIIQLEGDPAEEILGVLNEEKVSLVVVGSKEKVGTLVYLGSVSKAISEKAKCSVLIERVCE